MYHNIQNLTQIGGRKTSIENYFSDLQYGLLHSRGGDVPQTRRYVNVAERLLFWVDSDLPAGSMFIPKGLYFDLFDDKIFPITVGEPFGVTDNVSGFTFEQQYDAFNPFITTVEQFRDLLFTIHGSMKVHP